MCQIEKLELINMRAARFITKNHKREMVTPCTRKKHDTVRLVTPLRLTKITFPQTTSFQIEESLQITASLIILSTHISVFTSEALFAFGFPALTTSNLLSVQTRSKIPLTNFLPSDQRMPKPISNIHTF